MRREAAPREERERELQREREEFRRVEQRLNVVESAIGLRLHCPKRGTDLGYGGSSLRGGRKVCGLNWGK